MNQQAARKKKTEGRLPVPQVSEDAEQAALFEWAALKQSQFPELALLFHVPNGGKRDAITACKLKRQGVKAGVPDLVLPVARGGYHGLFIELKRKDGGAASKEQEKWIIALEAQGYSAGVCHGWESAAHVLQRYLNNQIRMGNTMQ